MKKNMFIIAFVLIFLTGCDSTETANKSDMLDLKDLNSQVQEQIVEDDTDVQFITVKENDGYVLYMYEKKQLTYSTYVAESQFKNGSLDISVSEEFANDDSNVNNIILIKVSLDELPKTIVLTEDLIEPTETVKKTYVLEGNTYKESNQ